MGARYSKIVNPLSKVLTKHLGIFIGKWSLVEIRSKMLFLYKQTNKKGVYFIAKEELRRCLEFTELQTYYFFKILSVENSLSSNLGDKRLSSLDFWSTLVLLSTASVDEKIVTCCKLLDLNDSGFISYNNLLILFICSTRGVAKLKGFNLIPLDRLEKTLIEIFAGNSKTLNENGDIAIQDLRDYMKSNDIIRTYLNNLGSRVEAVDPSALAGKRSNLLKDLATLQTEIERTVRLLDAFDEDEEKTANERGGDIKLLRLHDNPTMDETPPSRPQIRNNVDGSHDSSSSSYSFHALLVGPSASSLSRITVPLDHPSRRHFLKIDANADAEAFMDSRACKPAGTSKNIFGENFKTSFVQIWNKLPHNEGDDGTAYLDEYTLMGIFDNLGIFFPFTEAKKCLGHLRQQSRESQIARFNVKDVIQWFRLYGNANLPREESAVSTHWIDFCSMLTEATQSTTLYITKLVEQISTQKELLHNIQQLPPESVKKTFSYYKQSRRMEKAVAMSAEKKQKQDSKKIMSKDLAFLLSLHEFLNAHMSKEPTNVSLKYNFGRRTTLPPPSPERASPEKGNTRKQAANSSTKSKKPIKDDETKWKSTFKVFFNVNPFAEASSKSKKTVSRISKTGGESVIKDFTNLTAVDLIAYFNELSEAQQVDSDEGGNDLVGSNNGSHQRDDTIELDTTEMADKDSFPAPPLSPEAKKKRVVTYSSVGWICFQLREGTKRVQELALIGSVKNMLTSIPIHTRHMLYSAVLVDVFTVQAGESFATTTTVKKTAAQNRSPAKNAQPIQTEPKQKMLDQIHSTLNPKPRVLLIGCFHERNYFQELERFLVELEVFISRSFTRGVFELNLTEGFRDIYSNSSRFHCFEEKLFGPQEVDLGDEGMNPLKYAKELKQRKNSAMEFSQRALKNNMKKEELIEHCRILGIRNTGTLMELSVAVGEAYAALAAQIGHSEISKFGENVIEKMFQKYRTNEDPLQGLSLWEFNNYLHSTGSFTLYDMKEYKIIMNMLGLLVDRDGYLKVEGLKAYYLKHGRLADDNMNIGVGSLGEELDGNISFAMTYVPDAVASLFTLVGNNNTMLPKKIIEYANMLAATKEVKLDGEVRNLSETLDFLESLGFSFARYLKQRVLGSPGWLAEWVDRISQYFADGPSGVVPSLRMTVLKKFGKYNDFERLYTQDMIEKELFTAERDEDLQTIQQQIDDIESMIDSLQQQQQEDNMSSSGGSSIGPGNGNLEENLEQINVLKILFRKRYDELVQTIVNDVLPKLSPTAEVDLYKNIVEYKNDFIFLNDVHSDPTVKITPEINTEISARKSLLMEKIVESEAAMKENGDILSAHVCAAYDAVRLLTVSTPSIGLGSVDLCLRVVNTGVDWIHLLPPGLGEYSPIRQQRFDKLERAKQRKSAALAALERERLRRNMTDEEKEKARLEQLVLQQQVWNAEEEQLLTEALELLFISREERLTTVELADLVMLWEELVSVKEKRYGPAATSLAELAEAGLASKSSFLKFSIAQSNLACVLLEVYGPNHPTGSNASFLLEGSAKMIMDSLGEDYASDPLASLNITSAIAEGATSEEKKLTAEEKKRVICEKAAQAAVILNYIAFLFETESHSQLKQAFKMKLYVYELYHSLSSPPTTADHDDNDDGDDDAPRQFPEDQGGLTQISEEQERLMMGVLANTHDMPVFCYHGKEGAGKMLQLTLTEVKNNLEERARILKEEEEWAAKLAADAEAAAKEPTDDESVKSEVKSTKRLKQEKKDKYAEQRKRDADRRAELTRQRQIMYGLIQSGQISAVFEARTNRPDNTDKPQWGGLTQEDQEAVNKFSSLSHTGTTPGKEGDDSNMDTTRTRTPDNKHKS